MSFVPPEQLKPETISGVRAPAVLLKTGKYSETFLIVGEAPDVRAVFLDGNYRFQSFRNASAKNWSGLAVEGIKFELHLESKYDVTAHGRVPGVMIRRGASLSIVARDEGPFKQAMEIPVDGNLPKGAEDEAVGFWHWRAIIGVGKDKCIVWESKLAADERPEGI